MAIRAWQDPSTFFCEPTYYFPIMQEVIVLAALLSTFFGVSTTAPVLDFRGNPVTTDAEYTIEKDGIGFFGGLVLQSVNDSSCARYAGFSQSEVEPGIAVRFRPYYSGRVLQTGHGYRFKIEFTSAPPCAGGRKWSVSETYVVAGGKGNYFAVLQEEEGGKYVLADCRSCAVCRDLCVPLKTDDLLLRTDAENALNVYFAKSSFCAAADSRCDG